MSVFLLEEMVKLCNAATRPFESAIGVSQIAHDVSVLPAAALSTRSTQVAWRWRAVVNRTQSAYATKQIVGESK